jgi:hypothetical protein
MVAPWKPAAKSTNMTKPRKTAGRAPAAGTAAAAAQALAQAAAGWPQCPNGVNPQHWDAIMVARLPAQWAAVDLVLAENLARCLQGITENQAALEREGYMLGRGKDRFVNPRNAIVEKLNRRSLAITRLLQLHAVPSARAADKAGAKGEAGAAAAVVKGSAAAADDSDSLLAQPRRLQ